MELSLGWFAGVTVSRDQTWGSNPHGREWEAKGEAKNVRQRMGQLPDMVNHLGEFSVEQVVVKAEVLPLSTHLHPRYQS